MPIKNDQKTPTPDVTELLAKNNSYREMEKEKIKNSMKQDRKYREQLAVNMEQLIPEKEKEPLQERQKAIMLESGFRENEITTNDDGNVTAKNEVGAVTTHAHKNENNEIIIMLVESIQWHTPDAPLATIENYKTLLQPFLNLLNIVNDQTLATTATNNHAPSAPPMPQEHKNCQWLTEAKSAQECHYRLAMLEAKNELQKKVSAGTTVEIDHENQSFMVRSSSGQETTLTLSGSNIDQDENTTRQWNHDTGQPAQEKLCEILNCNKNLNDSIAKLDGSTPATQQTSESTTGPKPKMEPKNNGRRSIKRRKRRHTKTKNYA